MDSLMKNGTNENHTRFGNIFRSLFHHELFPNLLNNSQNSLLNNLFKYLNQFFWNKVLNRNGYLKDRNYEKYTVQNRINEYSSDTINSNNEDSRKNCLGINIPKFKNCNLEFQNHRSIFPTSYNIMNASSNNEDETQKENKNLNQKQYSKNYDDLFNDSNKVLSNKNINHGLQNKLNFENQLSIRHSSKFLAHDRFATLDIIPEELTNS